MAKTKKQIIEDLKLVDIVVEILDARVPIASQNPDIHKWIIEKPTVVILNKEDLADPNITKMWIEYFEKEKKKVLSINANKEDGIKKVIEKIKEAYKPISEKYKEKGRVGKAIRVMIVGIPNVGKSSLINRISKKTTAKVGNKPGITKQKQWIKVVDGIELLDTPGILWPKFDDQTLAMHLAYIGSIGDNAIDIEEVAFLLLTYLVENYLDNVISRYNLDKEEIENILKEDTEISDKILQIREKIGRSRGAILSGGRIDEQKVSRLIVNEYQSGKLGRISLEKPE